MRTIGNEMKQRTITTEDDLQRAARDLVGLTDHLPLVLTVTEGKRLRSSAQNRMYWSEVGYFREQITAAVDEVAEHTGYTPMEVKRLIAQELPIEQAVILFAQSSETVHEILKQIVGIPTSTRLGTKEFSKHEERLSQVMTEVIGSVKAVQRAAT